MHEGLLEPEAHDLRFTRNGRSASLWDRDPRRGPGDVRGISMTPEIMRQYLAAHPPELEHLYQFHPGKDDVQCQRCLYKCCGHYV